MNKREFQEQALLRSLDNVHPTTQVVRAAGELYDTFFPDEPGTATSEWIRFVDRQPTDADCITVHGSRMIQYWHREGMPLHCTTYDLESSCNQDPNCYWRPIPKLPEAR